MNLTGHFIVPVEVDTTHDPDDVQTIALCLDFVSRYNCEPRQIRLPNPGGELLASRTFGSVRPCPFAEGEVPRRMLKLDNCSAAAIASLVVTRLLSDNPVATLEARC